jgi:hypothetical protein
MSSHTFWSSLTQVVLVGVFLLIYRWWTNRGKTKPPKRSREEIVEQLRALVADPDTPMEKREWAADRLARLERPSSDG